MVKKILFIGDLNTYSRSFQRYRAMGELLYQVEGIGLYPEGRLSGIIMDPSLIERITSKLGYPMNQAGANRKITDYINTGTCPDLVWIENGKTVRPHTLRFIRQQCPQSTIVLYSNDNLSKVHNRSRYLRANIKNVDVIFIVIGYSEESIYRMGAKRVVFFHRGYDKNYITPRTKDAQFENEVVFIGTYEKDRYHYLEYLAAQGVPITVFGNGWPRESSEPFLRIQYKPLYHGEFIRTMHSSKIVLNFLRKMNDDVSTGRTFEIPASGAFMLAERSVAQQYYFVEGKEAEFFGSLEELATKVRYYLDHPYKRMRIGQNGFIRCQKSGYDYHSRLTEMLGSIDF